MLLEPSLFVLSKVAWGIVRPDHSLILPLAAGSALLLSRWHRLGFALVVLAPALILGIALFPTGRWILLPVENRFPPLVELPAQVEGIVILGAGPTRVCGWRSVARRRRIPGSGCCTRNVRCDGAGHGKVSI